MDLLGEDNFQVFYEFLIHVDADFFPTLSSRVDLQQYAAKLLKMAEMFAIFDDEKLVAVAAIYMNDFDSKIAYCPFIAVLPSFRGNGYARNLLESSLVELRNNEFNKLLLTVRADSPACNLYKSIGFKVISVFDYDQTNIQGFKMELTLK